MKTLFVCQNYTWASARFRARWPAKYMDGASVQLWENGIDGREAGAYVFVKVGDPKLFQSLRAAGKRVFWDLCDPSWWWAPGQCAELARLVDGIVCSCEALAWDCREWAKEMGLSVPVHCIPDRIDLECYPKKREHQEVSPVAFIWYGASQNRMSIFGGLANLERLAANGYAVSLTICDDHPEQMWQFTDMFPVEYVQWSEQGENELLAAHDVAFLPPYPGPWGRVKSNNKHLTAWACGLPVWDGQDYAEGKSLMDAGNRRDAWVQIEASHARYSAADWQRLVANVR